MKAAFYNNYGLPEVAEIRDVPKPVPGDNDVIIRVHTTTVTPGVWRIRKADPFFSRFMSGLSRPTKNTILGTEFSGAVESVGRAVTRFAGGR
ncbi:MAG TPA: hypothetical protein VI932_06775 [Bacteroidota bacterium]|nr:hypothetical protein [Bacteroidota bacterium]